MKVRILIFASVVLATVGVLSFSVRSLWYGFVRSGNVLHFFPWACLGVAFGLALAALVLQAARDPRLPRRLMGLVAVAPVFAVGYGLGRLLWGRPVSWPHILELGGLSLLVLGSFAGAVLLLRKT